MSPVIGPSPTAVPSGPTPPGPCDWPVNLACCPDWDGYSLEVQTGAMAWAVQILDSLTGRRFAQCARKWRPCGPRCGGPSGYLSFPVNSGATTSAGMPWMVPWIDNGVWRNCGCNGGCTCSAACEVPFPTQVAQIIEVTVDGIVIAEDAYRLDISRGIPVLVRTDGECWPECQDMDADADELGSFVITYQPGELVPLAGQLAAGLLACEFAKACVGADCSLPQQLASLSRNGVEVQVVDPATLLDNGLTGVRQVDLWVRSVNPFHRAQRSRVLSSDISGPRFTV